MVIVIDGYNVLRQTGVSGSGDTRKRDAFVAQLGAYAVKKKHYIIVVFDGGPYDRPYREYQGDVQVVYSGSGQTADEYICSYLAAQHNVELLLVSSDFELCTCADQLGFFSIDSCYFYRILRDALSNNTARYKHIQTRGQAIKLHDDTSPELDARMQEAVRSLSPKDQLPPAITHPVKQDKVTRKERRLLSILKKL